MAQDSIAHARIPTKFGEFVAYVFAGEHLALVLGDVASGAGETGEAGETPEAILTRVHSECVTGDVLGSLRCDCGPQLELAMEIIGTAGRGVLVYLRDHEGRGIGLAHKLQAYELQDEGLDTVDANLHQNLPADARDYAIAAEILSYLGVKAVRLLTNNPQKIKSLDDLGIRVRERVPLQTLANAENIGYLQTKRDRMGHLLGEFLSIDVSENQVGPLQAEQSLAV